VEEVVERGGEGTVVAVQVVAEGVTCEAVGYLGGVRAGGGGIVGGLEGVHETHVEGV